MDKMVCRKCSGRMFLDRVFTDNRNYETFCIMCGDRQFVSKNSELGQWLTRMETARLKAGVLAN